MDQDADFSADEPVDNEIAQLVTGVGRVCVSASMLAGALTYLTGLIDNWDDEKQRKVLSSPGQPLKEYRNLVPRLFLPLHEDAAKLADDARRLLAERHRTGAARRRLSDRRRSILAFMRPVRWGAGPSGLRSKWRQ